MEVEVNGTLLFLDILVMKRGPKLAMKVYQKPIHTDRYLHFKSNDPRHMKRGVVHSLIGRGKIICQEQDFIMEIKNIRQDLTLNEYPQEFVNSIMKPVRSSRPSETIYQGTVIIPYVKGISKKFRCTGNHFNVRTIFGTKYKLLGTLTKTGPVRDTQQTKQRVYNIPCECCEASRPLEVCIKEHKYNQTQGLLEKSKLAQYAYDKGNKICWKEAKVFQI
jgi:hypothetical protein